MPTRRIGSPHLPARPLAQRRIEIRERLVEQEHPRLGRQRAGERDPLLLAAGKLSHPAALVSGEVDQGQRPRHPLVQLVAADAGGFEAERHVLTDVEMGEEGVVLEYHAEAPGHRLDPRDVLAIDHYAPGIGRFESGQQSQRRRLAAPARPEQRQHLAPLEGQRDVVHREDARRIV